MLKLYGVPLSQPFRSVAWALLLKQCPFKAVVTVPFLADKPFGSKHESYKSRTKARSDRIPMLQDGTFYLVESPAILCYLCESRGWMDLYGPPGSQRKALIDSYMHWHHSGTRGIASLVAPYLIPGGSHGPRDKELHRAHQLLKQLESGWLHPDENYIVGNEISIADLLCYEELAQSSMTGLIDLADYPAIQSWMQRMEQQPFFEEVHLGLKTLGLLSESNDRPLNQRLQAATKAGLAGLEKAQAGFVSGGSQSASKL
ncbi:glutathione S-transferase [Fistulifera solaris]|uniref:Glutathione S-transferase n=1 Tax=Fistulifera solaris TaxID=1519565 RepID=A0A1Z5KRK5_FISSO|nr:glutathione S-transferase [Fistulifera solaris]|eukprot:GAX28735.1 glutathione S-transferase [Fistulifera solaris]